MNTETAPITPIGFVTEWQQPSDELQAKRKMNAKRVEELKASGEIPSEIASALNGRPIQIYPGI